MSVVATTARAQRLEGNSYYSTQQREQNRPGARGRWMMDASGWETALIYVPCFLAAGPLRQRRRARRRRLSVVIRLALPAVHGRRGARGRWPRRHGRLDVDLAVLDGVDEAPAVRSDAGVEAHVDVRLADIAPQDKRRAGQLGGGVPMAHCIQQHAWQNKSGSLSLRRQKKKPAHKGIIITQRQRGTRRETPGP